MSATKDEFTLDGLRAFLEEADWSVSECVFGRNSEPGWELSQYSPAGEDFSFGVCHNNDVEQAIQEIRDYAYTFDVDEHIEMWIEARNNGVAGVPSTRALVEDAQDIQEMLNTLAADVLTWSATVKARFRPLDDVIKSCEEVSKKQEQPADKGRSENERDSF